MTRVFLTRVWGCVNISSCNAYNTVRIIRSQVIFVNYSNFGALHKIGVLVLADFYTNFVNMCALRGFSPSGAAAAIGLSNAAATGWKKGKIPSDTTIAKLTALFGCTVADLTEAKKPTVKDDELSEYDIKIMELLRLVPEERKANIVALLEQTLRLSGLIE